MTEKKQARVLLAIPGKTWEAKFGMSILSLVAASTQDSNDYRIELAVQISEGSILPQLRHNLVRAAKKNKASHILFIDTDMTFNPYVLHELLDANLPIVAANCPTKRIPSVPTARLFRKDDPQGAPLYDGKYGEDQRYVKVWRVGTGVMLIEMSVFDKIPEPYFPITYDEIHGEVVGEDWGFCSLVEAAGIPITVDLFVSREIGHIGSFTYTPDCIAIPEKEVSSIVLAK